MSDSDVWRWLQRLEAEKRKRALIENTLLTILVVAGFAATVLGGSGDGAPA